MGNALTKIIYIEMRVYQMKKTKKVHSILPSFIKKTADSTIEKVLPNAPGVYLFKNNNNQVIYIGKANSIRKRVHSYFNKKHDDWKINTIMHDYAALEYILTNNEIEALLLEAQLIRQHQPKCNTLLKDGQPFLYILFTKNNMELVRNKKKKGKYIGPFLHKKSTRRAFKFLTETFKLNVCNKHIENGCLDYHIGNCAGSCKKNFDINGYNIRLNLAYQTIKQNKKSFIRSINKEIQNYNTYFEFEKAKHLYGYIQNIDIIFDTLKTKFSERKFEDQIFAATAPTALVQSRKKLAQDLQQFLNLNMPVHSIDCFDISHFQSSFIVGSCIRFTDGMPDKNKFRRFKINSLMQQNDYAALQEIVCRRYRHGDFPSLILIDGGKGQLNIVAPLVGNTPCISLAKPNSHKHTVDRIFLSDTKKSIPLDLHTNIGKALIALRDYAHHFAITYHRYRRGKQL